MCLNTIAQKTPKKSGYGWKVFTAGNDNQLWPEIFNGGLTEPYELGEWYYSDEPFDKDLGYAPRFHIFKHEKYAKIWKDYGQDYGQDYLKVEGDLVHLVHRKVEYDDALVEGTHLGYILLPPFRPYPAVVASYMRVLSE
jgi:hypothetical protein